ncbi:hypothetical protein DL98DRAFT_589207 [Cadophora sp. DSE1049]|nr:hypothetical protein DL98DRAFT_589207 [Cadophora sp. DSE1049]
MAEKSEIQDVTMPANPTPDEPSSECLKAISISIKLPTELRAVIFAANITDHISSSYSNVRSPLCIALAQLSISSKKSHQILYQQSLAAWDEKERRTFRITDQACALDLEAKKRKDCLAIEHLVFDLERFYHLTADAGQESGPLVSLRGHKITLSSNLKTICFRATAPFLEICLRSNREDRTPTPDLVSLLRNLAPAAARTLEKVVIEVPGQDRPNSMKPQEDCSNDRVNVNVDNVNYWQGVGHEKRRNSRGDWFLVWSAPYDVFQKGVHRTRRTNGYSFSPLLGFVERRALLLLE